MERDQRKNKNSNYLIQTERYIKIILKSRREKKKKTKLHFRKEMEDNSKSITWFLPYEMCCA